MIEQERMLDMSDVGLGNLNEYRLLVMLGTYHSLCLVNGLDITPDDISDNNGRVLYPAYYMTNLRVPLTNFIENYTLWDKVKFSVDIRKFGSNILDSNYRFEKADSSENGEGGQAITMTSNSLFVVDATLDKSVNRTISAPKANCIAELPKMAKAPGSLGTFKNIRKNGFELGKSAIADSVFQYKVCSNRDVSPNHGVIFAKFIEIMDICEREFLCSSNKLGLSEQLMDYIHVVERETYYYSNCFANDVIEVHIKIDFEECGNRNLTGRKQEVTPCLIHTGFELYNQHTHNLVAAAKAKKVICLPISCSDYEMDINRLIFKKYYK